jgi:hypothetical protein
MTRRTARAATEARPAPRRRAGAVSRAARGPDRPSAPDGGEGPGRRDGTEPQVTAAAEARWRLTRKGETFVASLRAASALGKGRR